MRKHINSICLPLLCTVLITVVAVCPIRAQTNASLAEKIVKESEFTGGLIVIIGGKDTDLAVALGKPSSVLVHWLVQDETLLTDVRQQIRNAGMYGRISAMAWEAPWLPYINGTVNLLLQRHGALTIVPAEADRVLAPAGVTVPILDSNRIGPIARKSRPADVDEWTHSRRDATGNAVSRDQRVGPPRFLQWEALPRWNRGTKTSALVSAQGRLFYILDDAHFASGTPTWSLIARDAHNGIRLWRHELSNWQGAQGGKKVGPAQVNRRLVAVGDRVYAQLGDGVPVSVLDAATGKVLRALDNTARAEEFLVTEGILVALVNAGDTRDFWRSLQRDMRIVAVNPTTGEPLWEHTTGTVLPMTLTADGRQVVYHDGQAIRSLDLLTGMSRWTSPPTDQAITLKDKWNPDSPGAQELNIILAPQLAPTMIIYGDVVAFAGGRQLNVVSAKDGHELWRTPFAATNYSVPVDLFGFDGALWGPDANMNLWRPTNDDVSFKAYDPLTGTVQKSVSGSYDFRFQHHRCYQMKVIGSTIMASRAGIEFLDTRTGNVTANHWTRGSCYFGVLPANGLLYTPPHNCACYIRAKLSGFMAMASERMKAEGGRMKNTENRLEKGPAYGAAPHPSSFIPHPSNDWPTYRHDAARSGKTNVKVDAKLQLSWNTGLGGNLTCPVVSNGRMFLASTDKHLLYALDADTGEKLWHYSFDARIDSPPTVYRGLVMTGCRDGSVVALRATDGALVWRFLAAPELRWIVSRGQLESVWPVHGSVLVVDDTVYFAVGKSSYLDGGLRFYGLEPHTGRVLIDRVLESRHENESQTLDDQAVDGFLNDILSSDGQRLFMRHQILDKGGTPQTGRIAHLHGPDGFLSADTTSRLIWTYAPLYTSPHQGAFYDIRLSRTLFPSGRMLVEDEDTIYGFGQNHYAKMNTNPGGQFALFACPKQSDVPLDQTARNYLKLARTNQHTIQFHWWKRLPIQVWAMVKTADLLFVAGAKGNTSISPAALRGEAPGLLLAVSPSDGTVLTETSLPSMPVWDGMAAAQGKLYITLTDGSTVCLGTSR